MRELARSVFEDRLLYETTSMCPRCGALVPGAVVEREHGIFLTRTCPAHGTLDGVVCSDREWYARLPQFDVKPIRPRNPLHKVEKGCPQDCGLCAAHKQIAGTAAIEISNKCNATCPVCLADNKGTFELSPADVEKCLKQLLACQDSVEVIALSGGEPTLHPQLFDILRVLERPEVGRVGINTNGVRIARDDAFLDELATHKDHIYVGLHFDGPSAKRIRGIDHELQVKALDRLEKWGIKVAPVVLAAQGVNDRELGDVVTNLLTRYKQVQSVVVSMLAFTGSGGTFEGDPMTRFTIPGALDAIEHGSRGLVKKRDFVPLPMPNPLCAAIGYFHVEGAEVQPLLGLAEVSQVLECLQNTNYGTVDSKLERLLREMIDRVYAEPTRFEHPEKTLRKFRELLLTVFPDSGRITAAEQRAVIEDRIKTVYLMQFMDAWTFDTKRLCKCSCQHLLPDGRTVPSCSYYAYHRRFDPRFAHA